MWPNSCANKRAINGPKINLKDLLQLGSKKYSNKEIMRTKIKGRKKNAIEGAKDLFLLHAKPHHDPLRKIWINNE